MAGAQRSGWRRDVSPGDWLAPRLNPFGQDTGSIVPVGFEAYARVFHPIWDYGRWTDLAGENGRVAHSQMQLHLISARPGSGPAFGMHDASEGSLPPAEREALVDLLTPHTKTPDRCWFAVWEGFGNLDRADVVERIEVPGRSYLLAAGPIESVLEPVPTVVGDGGQSPNLWWPDDRAWIVVTEIDFAWTYVGGSRAAIDAVLADDRLEAFEALISDDPKFDGDTVNAARDP
jgi:hypothetical protein